jgi:hypothetical protein
MVVMRLLVTKGVRKRAFCQMIVTRSLINDTTLLPQGEPPTVLKRNMDGFSNGLNVTGPVQVYGTIKFGRRLSQTIHISF